MIEKMIDARLLLKYRWRVLAALLLLMLLTLLLMRWWRGPQISTELVVRRDFVQTVVATGRIETPHRMDVGTQITGTVARVPVREGQTVRAGEVLLELEASEWLAAQRQAEFAVQQARARLRQVYEVQAPLAEQAVRQAQVTLDNARNTLRRNQDLLQKGFISPAALDDAYKAVELADAQLHSAQKQLETTGAQGSDIAVAKAALAAAQASAEIARARTSYARISAVVDGVLIARNVEVGDVVQPGKALMTLSPLGRTQVVVAIDEKNLRLLALGQAALASPDAYPQMRCAARLVYINPGVNAQTGAVEVKLDLLDPPAELKQDMTVSVDIEVARRPQALLVPLSAVHNPEAADGRSSWVLRIQDGRAVRQTVSLGLRSGGFAEVIEAHNPAHNEILRAGTHLIPVAAKIAAGARVRPTTSVD